MAAGESPAAFFLIMPNPLNTPMYTGQRHDAVLADSPTLGQYVEKKVIGNGVSDLEGSVFHDWLYPADKEARQLLMQQYQQSVEPTIRMEAMKDAGINPLTAAAGIAGSSPSNIPTPSSSSNPIGDIASAVGAVSSGYGAVAAGAKSLAEAEQVKPLAESTISKNSAEIDKWSHDNGFTDAQAQAFNIDNETRSEMNQAELNIKRQNFENMKEEANRIIAQKDFIRKQIQWYDDEIQSEIDLNKKRSLEAEKHAFLMQEQKTTEQMENDFAAKYHYRRDQPFDSAMLSCWFDGEFDKVQKAQDFMYSLKYGVSYNEAKGMFIADSETAYARAHAAGKGQFESDPFQQQYREIYDQIDMLSNQEKECTDILSSLKVALDKGLISREEYNVQSAKVQSLLRDVQKSTRELNKIFIKQSYSVGHASQLQNIKEDLLKIGVGVGLYSLGKSSPTVVKGFGH